MEKCKLRKRVDHHLFSLPFQVWRCMMSVDTIHVHHVLHTCICVQYLCYGGDLPSGAMLTYNV